MKIDITELKNYEKAVEQLHNNWEAFIVRFLTILVSEVMEKAMFRTPVDTGRLRRSWKIGIPEFDGDVISVEISNSAKSSSDTESYASFVEYGHFTANMNWVEGRFMLTLSMKQVEHDLQKVFDAAFKIFVKENGL